MCILQQIRYNVIGIIYLGKSFLPKKKDVIAGVECNVYGMGHKCKFNKYYL